VGAEVELRAVQPGEVAGLRRQVPHGGQMDAEQLSEEPAVAVEMGEQALQPGAAIAASTPRWPARTCTSTGSVASRARIAPEPATTTAHFNPAMFQALAAEM